ncbi:HXXEE domain-containing protein [Priestia megaterium]|uniref:HXXEE domain-containing protein n=2 Tax=Priestia megaterium TaxID=1404 RepID=UPI0012D8BFFC|nr:hypothetical protein [Priestia megaterium]
MKMLNPYRILWILPIVFGIHNFEELFYLQGWIKEVVNQNKFQFLVSLYNFNNLRMAMILLTLFSVIIVFMEYKRRNKLSFSILILGICLLEINGVTHFFQLIIFQRYNPGLISACLLIIPYMSYMLYLFYKNNYVKKKNILKYLLISIFSMNPIILMFLLLAKIIS